MLELPPPRFMPCDGCGASLEAAARAEHVCDPDRVVDYAVLRERVQLEGEVAAWLETPEGRFEAFYAARGRRRPC